MFFNFNDVATSILIVLQFLPCNFPVPMKKVVEGRRSQIESLFSSTVLPFYSKPPAICCFRAMLVFLLSPCPKGMSANMSLKEVALGFIR